MAHNKLLMVVNDLIDLFLDGRKNKYTTNSSYWGRWVKNIKGNVICLKKQEIKDSVGYLRSALFYYWT